MDDLPRRRRGSPAGMKQVRGMLGAENDAVEEHNRTKSKVAYVRPHHDLVIRVDSEEAVEALRRTEPRVARKEWLCFIALELGFVEDRRGILRLHRALLDPEKRPKPQLTPEEVADYYGISRETVLRYDRTARATFNEEYDAVLHEPKMSYWWGDEWGHMTPKVRASNQQESGKS